MINKRNETEFKLPVFQTSTTLNIVIESLPTVDASNFSLCHGVSAVLVYRVAQIRSRAMTAGVNNPQDMTRIESVNHIMKLLGNNNCTNIFSNVLGLVHIIPYMSKEELKNPSEIYDEVSTKGGKNKFGHSKEQLFANHDTRVAEAKGKAKSVIGKLQSIPIYNTTDLPRYSDSTIGMLYNKIWRGADRYTQAELSTEVLGLFPEELVFQDGIVTKNASNLTPMESSLSLP